MLHLDSVCFRYDRALLNGLCLRMGEGEIRQLTGPNGSGKTTLLRLLAGVLLPESGTISWRGRPLQSARPKVGFVPAGSASFYPRLSVRENLEYFGAVLGFSRKESRQRMQGVDFFGVDFWESPFETCSQGMRQKVAWIRALMNDPELLLLDEAWNGLDRESWRLAQRAVEGFQGRRSAILVQHNGSFPFPAFELPKNGGLPA